LKKLEILKVKKEEEDAKWIRALEFDKKKEERAELEHKLNVEILELQKKYWLSKIETLDPNSE
jgi:hypothetical protein